MFSAGLHGRVRHACQVEGYTQTRLFWDSTVTPSTILALLTNAVAARPGPEADERFGALRSFGDHFEEFEP